MKENIKISGFADEIAADFDEQLKTVTRLDMKYICLRTADGKGIGDYTLEQVQERLLPRLQAAKVGVSSLGSLIGKIGIEDEVNFERQLGQLDNLCKIARLLDCRYIRVFSFYIPHDRPPEAWREKVLEKLRAFIRIARRHGVVLINENEKELYADTGLRCHDLMESLGSSSYRTAFDFANFVQCGEDTEKCWDLLKNHIEYIHIKDAVSTDKENVLCGTGEGKIAMLLQRAIKCEGYEGFLTLEPHLVLFDALSKLETATPADVIKTNKAKDGAEGYAMQYNALRAILDAI